LSQSLHDEFLELCAISTSGELTTEERSRLQKHLAGCPTCRVSMKQYEAVVSETISGLTPASESGESDPSWAQEQAEASFFQRLTLEEELGWDRGDSDGDFASKRPGRVALSVIQTTWRNVWTLYAAGVLLFIALAVSAYQVAIQRGTSSASLAPVLNQTNPAGLQQQARDAGHDQEALRAEMRQRDQSIADLRDQLKHQSAEMARIKVAAQRLDDALRREQADKQALVQERTDLEQKFELAQAQTQGLQDKLNSLEQQSSQDNEKATALEAKVGDLNRLLRDRETAIDEQEEFLAHDRDIRELMGARDLYIAEVYDVGRDGKTQKTFGRVFYTKGKSLVFYAYDLDHRAEVKTASTFQAWGRRGPDRQQALNLGVFYEDNASKKRWVLRFDDPKTLDNIDAVFVTVEPNGGSQKPSGRSLLFAYLRMDPNHP
jgi:hypothetical protein